MTSDLDVPQPDAPVVLLAEQYHAMAGDGTIAIAETARTIAAMSAFIGSLLFGETRQWTESVALRHRQRKTTIKRSCRHMIEHKILPSAVAFDPPQIGSAFCSLRWRMSLAKAEPGLRPDRR